MSIGTKIRNLLRRTGHEVGLHASAMRNRRTDRPRVLFFPSGRREGASLLRAYNMADALTRTGWHAAAVPADLKLPARRRVIRHFAPDILVFQQCRHALNDTALRYGDPVVLDTDDADFFLTIPGLVERLQRTSQAAVGVMAGSQFIQEWHAQHNANAAVIWTGTPITAGPRPDHHARQSDGPPILAWAQAAPLSYVNELDFVRGLVADLRAQGAAFRLRFYGIATEEERDRLRTMFPDLPDLQMLPPMGYDAFLQSLHQVAVGLSPIITQNEFSRGKSFGKILGYLDAKVPVIASDEADHARFFTETTGVVTNDRDEWLRQILALLGDPDRRNRMADAAFEAFQRDLSIEAAARKTDAFLRDLLTTR